MEDQEDQEVSPPLPPDAWVSEFVDTYSSEDLLWEWVRFGWRYRRIGGRPQAEQDWYAARVKYELALMLEKELADFMLFTSDAIRWAKDNDIPIGPGRGSTAASVVAWLLRITEIDPYRYQGMLFERFLDVSRADPPDIDIDCSDERRDDVRSYLAEKYGAECVGQIANFIRYRAKNSIVDIARVYRIPVAATEVVKNLIVERSGGDSRFDSTLEDTVDMFPNAAEVFDQFPDLWKATRLEGNVKGMSVHAAGLIVSTTPLTDICAVYERDGRRVLSIDKYDIEYVDALKLDFLGLSTMGMIARCLAMADLTLEDLYAIPDTDEDTVGVFRQGDVTGIFQFEGRATRLVNRDVLPDHFAHIADVNALSRPGPLFSGTTAEYVDVRHGRRQAEHLHPMVTDITRDTYGQIIYQEQILRILKEMGGFDWFSVGQIRRIISKKLGEAAFQMNQEQFTEGALRLHSIPHETAMKIWKRLVTSGTYSFNIAHAISYSMIAFWTAWLKCHYPVEFYAASLQKADEEQQFRLMRDALAHDIEVTPPKIEISRRSWIAHYDLSAGKRELVAGWAQVPGIGAKTAERLEFEGEGEGGWTDWRQMLAMPGIGPKTIARMEEFSNAYDPFGLKRTDNTMARSREWLRHQRLVPMPTHNGTEVAAIRVKESYGAAAKKNYGKGPRVVYAGIVRERNMQDAVENRRSRTGEEAADILRSLKHPELLEYCSLRCYDTTEEEVYLRVNRFVFPRLKRKIERISVGHDVVVAVGNRIAGFGTPVMVENIYVIDPD